MASSKLTWVNWQSFCVCWLFLVFVNGQIPETTIVLQNQFGFCSSIWNPQNRTLQDRDVYNLISQTYEQTFYEADRNCVVSIRGKEGYQWQIRITKFDVEGQIDAQGIPIKCNDFVKIYDAERCDNAKLLKGISFKTGLCGTFSESLLGAVTFSTCANHLTVQFKSDIHQSANTGFAMELTQQPWQNPTGGPDCDPSLNGIAPGVWRDGTFTEFQNSWDEQPVIPGYVPGGNDNNYNQEVGGISCYECSNCPVEPFDPKRDVTAVATNCYTCSKEWDEEYQSARRRCYTRNDYLNLILSLNDINTPFEGCKKIYNDYGRTVNYCFCMQNNCNHGNTVYPSVVTLLLTACVFLFGRHV